MKITVLDGFTLNPGDLTWGELEKLGKLTVYDRTPAELVVERCRDSEIVFTNKTPIDGNALEALPKLKYIGVLATGYNVVDVVEASKHGVTVTNIPAYSTMSVAQHVFAMLLTATDHVEHYAEEVRDGKWCRSKDFCFTDTPLIEVAGKKMGIIGFGNIGRAVGQIAQAFGMNVIVYTSKTKEELPPGVEKVSLRELFSDSDVITLHCPLTESTKEIINRDSLSLMKEGVILINTGRGPLIDEEAVAQALEEGKLKAFCADVLSSEPPAETNPLLRAPNVYITPHIAWATKEARERLINIAVSNLQSYLAGHPVNIVS
ncbi:MAG: D-2-hydroxyacid dehydrogenase [Muribaculaceae bacterium]|nr:D-2-hydroxyacid dehydrogenase [Muribaculaceae bacterium]